MKRALQTASIAIVLCCLPSFALAWGPNALGLVDKYNLFRFNIAPIFVLSPNDPGGYGGGLALEPMFNILNQLSAGMRVEGSAFAGGSVSGLGTAVDTNVRGVASILGKAELYFTQTLVRPFIAFGMGGYYAGGVSSTTTGASADTGSWHFGVMPQVGVNISFLRIAVAYHVLFGDSLNNPLAGAAVPDWSYNYLAFELGFVIGGGKKSSR